MAATSPQRSSDPKKLPSLPHHIRIGAPIQRQVHRRLGGWWAWELVTAAIAAAALVALIALLASANGQQQRTWAVGRTELTLNALVAVLATIIRSALVLIIAAALNQNAWNWFAAKKSDQNDEGQPLEDLEIFCEAAANSWNSLQLLLRTKGQYVASLGAVITILALAFDVFVQQVVGIQNLPQQMILTGANLSSDNILPRSLEYYAYDVGDQTPVDTGLEITILGGVLNQTNASMPGAVCPTENCTWPVTPTLAVCGACDDAQSQLQKAVNATTGDIMWTVNQSFALANQDGKSIHPSITLTNFSVNSTTPNIIWQLEAYTLGEETGNSPTSTAIIAKLFSLGFANVSISGAPGLLTFDLNQTIQAYNCTLKLCLQAFSAASIQGKMTQERIGPGFSDTYQIDIQEDWGFGPIPPEYNAPNVSAFSVTELSQFRLGNSMSNLLNVNAFYLSKDAEQGFGASSNLALLLWEACRSLASFDAAIQAVADGLTTSIRTWKPPPAESRYSPTVSVLITVVQVRWAWLAYPLALVLGGFTFLILTIIATRRRSVRPWKGHRVPLLLAELDETLRTRAKGGLARRTGLDDRVGAARVRLDYDSVDGLRFRRVHPSLSSSGVPLKDGS